MSIKPNKPRDGEYPAIQSGYELTFTAPDSVTGKREKFMWTNPVKGIRGFNFPTRVRVVNGEISQP